MGKEVNIESILMQLRPVLATDERTIILFGIYVGGILTDYHWFPKYIEHFIK